MKSPPSREVLAVRPVVAVGDEDVPVRDDDLRRRGAALRGLFGPGVIAALAARGALLARVRRARGQPLRAGTPAGVDQPEALQPLKGGLVAPRAQALTAGGVLRPAEVPVEAQPAQVLGHEARIFVPAPLRVQVLEPEEQLPAQGAHVQPGEQGREHVSKVQPPAGTGREAAAGLCVHIGLRVDGFQIVRG